MMICLPSATFSATFAPAGTGKLPSDPLIAIVRPELAGVDVDLATDALWLDAGALVAGAVVAGAAVLLAVVMPAVHAATDTLAAQQARASAVERYLFIGFLYSVRKSQVRRSGRTDAKLDRGHTGRIPVLSQARDIRRNPGSVRHRKPDADHGALAVPAADRDLAAVPGHDDPHQRQPDAGPGQAARRPAAGQFLPDLPDL